MRLVTCYCDPYRSGSSPWTNTFNIIPQFHPANPDNDNFNREAVADNSTGKNIITLEPDLLGLTTDLKYGDYAALKGEMSYGYDKFLRPLTLHSNGSTRALDITLIRELHRQHPFKSRASIRLYTCSQ